MADARNLGSIAKGVARGLKTRRAIADLAAQRELERIRQEEQTRQFDIAENRRQGTLFEERKRETSRQERQVSLDVQERIERLAKQQREREPIALINTLTGERIGEAPAGSKFVTPKAAKQPKETPQQKFASTVLQQILKKGITEENVDIFNVLSQSLGTGVSAEEVQPGLLGQLGRAIPFVGEKLVPREFQPTLETPAQELPQAAQELRQATDAELRQALAQAGGDVTKAREILAEQGLTE